MSISSSLPARITRDEIGAAALARALAGEVDGAIVTFEGIVRRLSRGKRIRFLEYDVYPEMAEKQLDAILHDVSEKWPDVRAAVEHRIGRLEVGEVSVAIAAVSPHRAEAFAACRHIIEEIKHRVPIWKKEFAEDGEEWIEGG